MIRPLFRMGLFSVMVFAFQNCGGFEAADRSVPYPYSTRPDFFFDVKMVSLRTDELGRESYNFDVAITFATNPNQSVNYRVAFSTLDRTGICRSVDQTAIGPNKHQRFPCTLPTPDDLYLQLTLLGPNGEENVEQFRF